MIFLLNKGISKYPNIYAKEWGPAPGSRMQILRYKDLLPTASLRRGTYIFSDLEVLSDAERSVARSAWQQLSTPAFALRLLNDPSKALNRFDLLSRLHREGLNRFRAVRANDMRDDLRFPVFVRYDQQHTGPLTPLLRTRSELQRALRYLRFRGAPLSSLLVVEFCDTSDSEGIVRKYAAFLVGDRVLPRHLFFSREWMVKGGGPLDRAPMDERLEAEKNAYLYGNPHERWIKEVFQLAGIDFGRLDYGALNGVPQVWEINTNPTIKDLTPRLTQALDAIDHSGPTEGRIRFSADPALLRAWHRAQRRERMRDVRSLVINRVVTASPIRPVVKLAKYLLH